MHFLLTNLNVVYVLNMPMPTVPEDAENESLDETRKQLKWENDDYICRGHILNGMSDPLFDVYLNVESAKELPVMEQYNELLCILGQFAQHNMKMDESISVSSIIDKLPPSWMMKWHGGLTRVQQHMFARIVNGSLHMSKFKMDPYFIWETSQLLLS
ncbi:hypothetical protein YC2023_058820 [Brassica napus]